MAQIKLVAPTAKPIELKPVHPNIGIEVAYRKKLHALVEDMNKSLIYWLGAEYKASGAMTMDESPAAAMRAAMRKMARRWQRNFDRGADELAVWFAQKTKDYADVALKNILKDAGFAVEFKMTPTMQNAYESVIGEQVGLIRSIASQHLTRVETMVMQSVQVGRDLGTLTDNLQKEFGVTRRRAAFIALDQNNKASAILTNERQRGLGLKQARWRHSHAGKVPRPSHVAAGAANVGKGEIYDIDKGLYLDGVWTWPGREIGCRCSQRGIIPGFIE